VAYAVVGIGINCNQSQGDFPAEIRDIATSLFAITAVPVNRGKLAAAIIDALYSMSETLLSQKAALINRYRADCVTLGKAVAVHRFDTVRHGTAIDMHQDCALIVQFSDGDTQAISAGEVSIRGMYGYV
jgi:BirA family biotin operon repressor/biotin-[acetyl-CoA-carboxylase] ligase